MKAQTQYVAAGRLLAVLVTAFALTGCSGDDPAMPAPRVVIVNEAEAVSGRAIRTFTGTLRAVDRADLAFQVGGVLASVSVELGQAFAAGDVLAQLDPAQASASRDAARAALQEAEDSLANAADDAERFASLRGTGAVAENQIDQALVRRDNAAQRVLRLKSELARSADALRDHTLRAPFAGTVSRRWAEPSNVVKVGETVLTIAGTSAETEAVASVPERWASLFTIGSTARIELAASGRQIDGTVAEVATGAGAAGLVQAIIRMPVGDLTPGASVRVSLEDKSIPSGVFLPFGSFRSSADGSATVFVVGDDDVVTARPVTIGAMIDEGAIAISGLEPGELIATKGASRLRDGEKIERSTLRGGRYLG